MKEALLVWVNGQQLRSDAVRVSPFDLGMTVGLGVFETLQAYDGAVFGWPAHWSRMLDGIARLGLNMPDEYASSPARLEQVMHELLLANGLERGRARVRVALSGGENPLAGGQAEGMLWVTAIAMPEPASVAKLVVSDEAFMVPSAIAGVKSASYAASLIAYRKACLAGADEALCFDRNGELCEGAMSNVFLVRSGRVMTPPLASGCLAGVTRAMILEWCPELGIECLECPLSEEDVRNADELFLTSAAREVQAAYLGDQAIAGPGPFTARLQAAYRQKVLSTLGEGSVL